MISKYSNNSIVRNLSTEERLYLYEAKRVFDIHYLNTNPAHAIFLDTKFKTKYNCGKLFIPVTSSKNPNQKGRNDQKYCNNLYLDTGKTCKEIGALNKQKEKVQNSSILKEYNREYKNLYWK